MTHVRRFTILLVAGALAGCANGGPMGSGKQPRDPNKLAAASVLAQLMRSESCDDLLGRIQADVIAKIDVQAELIKEGGAEYLGNQGGGVTRGDDQTGGEFDDGFNGPFPTPSAPGAGGSAAPPTSGGGGTGGTGGSSARPTDHSDTNVQVEGVDEADIVKTDGTHIYLLHGNELLVLTSWPAAESSVQNRIRIEGNPTEMFVSEGVAAIFSSTYDQGDLIELPDDDAKAGASDYYDDYYGSPFTKLTMVDVQASTPRVLRELFIEGSYLSSRLHGDTVRAVIQGGFRAPRLYAGNIEVSDPWGRPYPEEEIDAQVDGWRDRMIAAIEDTTLTDWLPVERELVDGELADPERRCTDFYAPSPGLTGYGLTNIVSFDITDPASKLGGAIILGSSDEVYSNDSALLLAQRDWRWDQKLIEKERTVLHRFALDGAETSYEASGWVAGHILDQFSLDEQNGVIRVATTARIWQDFEAPVPIVAASAAKEEQDSGPMLRTRTDNRVITLRTDGNDLVRAGITVPLGKDGESLTSSRFVGDRAYVVTFERKDPLVVVDLSDVEELDVLGELVIPGFSDYMHPLADGQLLTIGRDTDASGIDTGLMLQIFDVTDPKSPRRSHTYKFGENGYSEANVNHKAFTFHRPAGAPEGTGLLAFPYVRYDTGFASSLEVFDVAADAGFKKLGSIAHTTLLQNLCGNGGGPDYYGCVQPEVRRGLFIFGNDGDFVYSISYGGLMAHDLTNTQRAVATVPFTMPDFNSYRDTYGDGTTGGGRTDGSGGVGTGGAAGAGTAGSMPADAPPPSSGGAGGG